MTLHPASLLLAWVTAAIALQQLPLPGLADAAVAVIPCAMVLAPARSWQMLRRSRWLLLSLALLFSFGTPGQIVPQLPWLTRDGLELAIEHVLRLSLLLLLLSLLLQRVPLDRLMVGLHFLLLPWVPLGLNRRKAVARLTMVIDYVQGDHNRPWREWLAPSAELPKPITLNLTPMRGVDWAAIATIAGAAMAGALRSA